jgi:general secretion pathway protein A
MYEAYYGLRVKPFQLNPDPAFYFDSKQHRRAKAYLEYGLHQNEGFIVVTGDIGAGKTTIVRGLLESLDQENVVAAQLVSTQLDADDTLRMVAAAFGVRFKDMVKADVLLSIEAFLVNLARRGKRCLLVVDEAQNLTQRAVEELRMLSNFQFESHALLQTFLVGQPEFRAVMLAPQMEQLRQRVIAACHIGPLDSQETQAYIQHRLACAGSKGEPSFDPEAYPAIYQASGGVPRRINSLCDRLLLMGFLSERKSFGQKEVEDVVAEMHAHESRGPTATSNSLHSPKAFGEDYDEIALGAVEIDSDLADSLEQSLAGIGQQRIVDRLVRLERSLIRLEQTNSLMLNLMLQLVEAARGGKQAKSAVAQSTQPPKPQ